MSLVISMSGKRRLSRLSDKKKRKRTGVKRRKTYSNISHLDISDVHGIMKVKLVMGPLSG